MGSALTGMVPCQTKKGKMAELMRAGEEMEKGRRKLEPVLLPEV